MDAVQANVTGRKAFSVDEFCTDHGIQPSDVL